MGYFVPIWMTKSRRKEKWAVWYLKKHHSKFNQEELYQMVKKAPLPKVRREVLLHIEDEGLLGSIVRDETMEEMYRVIAAERIQSLEQINLLMQCFYTAKIRKALYEKRKLMVDRLLWQLEHGRADVELAERIIRFSVLENTAEKAYSYLPREYFKKRLEQIDEHRFLLRYYDSYTMNKIAAEEKRRKNRTPEEIQYEDACARDEI